jgi:ribosomal protein S18 acetylase RimI-like enzyme
MDRFIDSIPSKNKGVFFYVYKSGDVELGFIKIDTNNTLVRYLANDFDQLFGEDYRKTLFDVAFNTPVYYIEFIHVRDEFQREGIAKSLLEHTLKANSEHDIYLEIMDDHPMKEILITFYQKYGFSQVYHLSDSVLMRKSRIN